MKNKSTLNIALFSLIIFILIASYLWYLYFKDYEKRIIAENPENIFIRGVELINTGGIDYVNAKVEDEDSIIPTYYFSVKNNIDEDFKYTILLEETDVNDGCTSSTRLKPSELTYVLKLDNKVIKEDGLDKISNNILDTNVIKGNTINDYSLKIRLKDGITDYDQKHFHYVINLKESK